MKSIKGSRQQLTVLLEKKENLVSRVKNEIIKKVGMIENEIIPYKSTEKIKNSSTYYENYELEYFHFYLKQNRQRLNGIKKIQNLNELKNYETVPELDKILFSLF